MRQLTLTGSPGVCPRCGYENIPDVLICWWCGECLDQHVKKLAEGSK